VYLRLLLFFTRKGKIMYEVEIKDSNKFFNINNKTIRSPFKAKISDTDIERIISTIRCQNVISYTITKISNESEKIKKINDKPENIEPIYLKHMNRISDNKKEEQKIDTYKSENIEVTIIELKKKADEIAERISEAL